MKKTVAVILLLFIGNRVMTQPVSEKDSLKQVYLAEKNDSIKIWKHLDYVQALISGYEQTAQSLTEIELLKKELAGSQNNEFKFWALMYEGFATYQNAQYLNSIIAIEKMNRLVSAGSLSQKAIRAAPVALISLGLDYSKLNDLENAQLTYQKALNLLKEMHDSANVLLTYVNMGYLFMKGQDLNSAIKTFETGMPWMDKEAAQYFAVPLYSSLSVAHAKTGNDKAAADYLKKAAAAKEIASTAMAENFYAQAKGENEMQQKNYAAAIGTFSKAVEFGRRWGDTAAVAESYESLGRAYWKQGNYQLGLQSLLYCRSLIASNNIADQEKIILKSLFEFYHAAGQYKNAASTADTLFMLGDSLSAVQNNNRRIIVNALFESEQNAKQISSLQQQNELSKLQLKQKNTVNYILGGTALALLLISLLGFANHRQKKKLQQQRIAELEKEKQLLATEAVLKGQEEERSRLAKDLHDGLGGMLSGIKYSFSNIKDNLLMTPDNQQGFERGLDMLDASISELRRVAHSMMPEALAKYGLNAALKDFCTGINSSGVIKVVYQSYGLEDLKTDQAINITIYRIIQELLNNTIKHAAASKAVVQVNKEDDKLLVTVEDDGKGFDTTLLAAATGIGWSNIQKRLDYLKASVDIQSSAGKGTSVNIEIEI